jgi:hypothetical protein
MLIGARTALVAMGLSCQPAHQLLGHRVLAGRLSGEALAAKTTPFDWRIAGLSDIAAMVAQDEFFPTDAGELTIVQQADPPGSGAVRPIFYWPRRRCWFWHEFVRSRTAITLKQQHLAQNFSRLAGVERRLFFVSNLQNNLTPLSQAGRFDAVIRRDDAVALWRGLEARFGPSSLHLLTRPELVDGFGEEAQGSIFLHHAPPDNGCDWRGDDGFWEGVIAAALAEAANRSPASG